MLTCPRELTEILERLAAEANSETVSNQRAATHERGST
jgi:hypothetical protein